MPYYYEAITKRRNEIHRGLVYGGRHIFKNDFKDIEYSEICSKQMDESVKNFLIRIVIISSSLAAVSSGPIHAYFFKGIKTTIIEVRIPYTDENSNGEFFGNMLVHMCISIYGSLGFVGMEIAMEIFIGVISIGPKLVAYEFRKMDENIKENLFTKLQFRLTFRNIVQQITDVDE